MRPLPGPAERPPSQGHAGRGASPTEYLDRAGSPVIGTLVATMIRPHDRPTSRVSYRPASISPCTRCESQIVLGVPAGTIGRLVDRHGNVLLAAITQRL